jgi:tRNA nucleotidyltransferase (CCA-adding enzyme)
VAGGAVRDILMDKNPTDVDIATTATPGEMKAMFLAENIRLINMNGEKHGTITPRMNNSTNYEVTTLRIDVLTDGRHAEVEFTTDWLLDANRRDLTINSMFLGFDGTLYDYFYGYEDLERRRVAFVGHADKRIKEDFLRILRYFRFYGRIAENADNHDAATLQAIAENATGLKQISGERIWTEMRKILLGNFASELVGKMVDCGLSRYIGLPEKPDVVEFERVCRANEAAKNKCNAITLLSGLLTCPEDALRMHERLKLSAFERDLAFYITQNRKICKDFNTLR